MVKSFLSELIKESLEVVDPKKERDYQYSEIKMIITE